MLLHISGNATNQELTAVANLQRKLPQAWVPEDFALVRPNNQQESVRVETNATQYQGFHTVNASKALIPVALFASIGRNALTM